MMSINQKHKIAPRIIKRDIRYQKSEKSIQEALDQGLTDRQINLKAGDICRLATITRPTFYAHCRDSNDALEKYEVALREDFWERLSGSESDHEVIWTALLGFVYDQKGYFVATIPNSNFWLLRNIMCDLRPQLAQDATSNKIYDIYAQQQIGLIGCWVKYEDCATNKIPFYVTKLRATRLVDLGL